MNKLIAGFIAGAFALGSVAAMADNQTPPIPVDQDELKAELAKAEADYDKMTPVEQAAYKLGMASQRQHDLQAQEAKAQDNPPATPEESKAIKEAAMKARAAYARMTPEEKAMFKKGMRDQRQMDLNGRLPVTK